MTCLQLSNGDFTALTFSTAANYNAGLVTISRVPPTTSTSAGSITIQRAGQAGSITRNGDFSYVVFGDQDCVALMQSEAGIPNERTYTVQIVDITTPTIQLVTLVSTSSLPTDLVPPQLFQSPGNGRLIFSVWSTANDTRDLSIRRSDNGQLVLLGPGTISDLSGSIGASVTATQLIINHPRNSGPDQTVTPRPAGSLLVVEGAIGFGEAVLNADIPGLATVTRTFTLRNDGNDCLEISGIGDAPPFTVAPGLQLPETLAPGAELTVPVIFAPTAPANNIVQLLPVTRVPANGMSTLMCEGDAREAQAAITLAPASLNFGAVPAPAAPTRNYTIENTGERTVTITIPPPPLGGPFNWAAVAAAANVALAPAATRTETVTYAVNGATPVQNGSVTVTPSLGAPRTVQLSGRGCVAQGVLDAPVSAPVDFGDVQQGFRMVRTLRLGNSGNGDLQVNLRIVGGNNPQLYGIQRLGQDITQAENSVAVTLAPVGRCGPGTTGPGEETFGIVFHADTVPGDPLTAGLEVVVDGVVVRTYQLTAAVTPAVPVDGVLVFDVSGSMSEAIGARNKLEAARAAGQLFIQLLRQATDDRMALIAFQTTPADDFPISRAQGNRTAFEARLAALSAGGSTNITGGLILGEAEFNDPPHPANPPVLEKVMIVLTDGKENRCFQRGGAGPWFSITGRGAADGMRRPDGTPQNTSEYVPPVGVRTYAVGLGQPADIDVEALDAISSGRFANVVELTGRDFFQIEKYFTQIFMDAVNLAIVSDPFYTVPAGDEHLHEFDILPGDVNAMVVIYDTPGGRLPLVIETPGGEIIDGLLVPSGFGLRFHSSSTARFVEIVFPRNEPHRSVGRWRVVVAHHGRACAGEIGLDGRPPKSEKERKEQFLKTARAGFLPETCSEIKEPVGYGIAIGAGSNLRMQPFVEPGVKRIGETIRLDAVISEAGLPVTGASVKVEVKTPADAVHQVALTEAAADDGDYAGVFHHTSGPGTYRFTFRAEGMRAGKPWRREVSRTKTVVGHRGGGSGGEKEACCDRMVKLLSEVLGQHEREPEVDVDAPDYPERQSRADKGDDAQ